MSMRSNVDSSQNAGEGATSNEVAFSSDSLSKLQAGLDKTLAKAQIIKERIDARIASATVSFVCNQCKKEFKTLAGAQKHWSKKNKTGCNLDSGYIEKRDMPELSIQDKLLPEELSLATKIASARKAAVEVALKLHTKTTNEGGFTVKRLMSYPIGNFNRALKEAPTSVLEEFVASRFDSGNGPKKTLAQHELELRKSRGNG